MIDANELNSTFFALRLLSHRLDISEIKATHDRKYPASEFTRREQEKALRLIKNIEVSESLPISQLSTSKIELHMRALADRIEGLANSDLTDAGYNLETTIPRPAPTQAREPAARDLIPAVRIIVDKQADSFFKVQLENTEQVVLAAANTASDLGW